MTPNQQKAFAAMCVAVLGLLTPLLSQLLAGNQGTLVWLVDLAAHWQWLYLVLLALSALILSLRHPAYLATLILSPLPWFTSFPSAASGEAVAETLSVGSINLSMRNDLPTQAIPWIEDTAPDVVVLLEVTEKHKKALSTLSEYPHKLFYPAQSPFGIGLLSRLPIRTNRLEHSADGIPSLAAELHWNGSLIRIIGFHPMPPLFPEFHTSRNQTLRQLAQTSVEDGFPTIIAGDFNATPWSVAFNGLETLGFRRSSGLAPTWPAVAQGLFGIPIDQILVSSHWKVIDSNTGITVNSDHLPIASVLRQ